MFLVGYSYIGLISIVIVLTILVPADLHHEKEMSKLKVGLTQNLINLLHCISSKSSAPL